MNVIFLMSDTYRRDNLSCYGPSRVQTPSLDRLAAQSYVFEDAYLGSFPTVPNRLDIMSGRFSHLEHEWCPLPSGTVTVQQILSGSGFTTMMIVDNPHLIEMGFNYSRGFNGWEWIRGQETDVWRTAPRNIRLPNGGMKNRSQSFILTNYLRNISWWQNEEDRFAPRTIRAACRWLEENQDQDKFFLYLDLFDPHEPWDAPKHYLDLYEKEYNGAEITYPQYDFWREYLSEEELRHYWNLYRAEATMVDRWIGVLLDKMDELGLTEDTALIFCSDHGFLFGEHDLIGKSLMPEKPGGDFNYEAVPMYGDIRRQPLLIRLPGQTRSQRVAGLVQSPDLMPTILELAGLVVTEQVKGQVKVQHLQCGMFTNEDWSYQPELTHGKSLVPLMNGQAQKIRDIAVCSNTIVHHNPILAKSAIVTEDGYCLHYDGSYSDIDVNAKMYTNQLIPPAQARISTDPMLFCVRDDPGEQKNIIDSNEGLARSIHGRYVSWLEEHGTPERHIAGRRELR